MKKMFVALSLSVATLSASTLASAQYIPGARYTVLTCQDANGIADNGYLVSISSGGFDHKVEAKVSRQTFYGPQDIATLEVESANRAEMNPKFSSIYFGPDFRLTISAESSAKSPYYYDGLLKADIRGLQINTPLLCQYTVHTL